MKKRIISVLITVLSMLLLSSLLVGCGDDKTDDGKKDNEKKDIEKYEIMLGESVELQVDSKHDERLLCAWKVADETIAIIEDEIKIAGIKAGTTEVIGLDGDGEEFVRYPVEVKEYALDAKYNAEGSYEVKSVVKMMPLDLMAKYQLTLLEQSWGENFDWDSVKIWYPAELETSDKKYPVVAFCNGSNGRYDDELGTPEFLEYIASHGFIVLGNNQENDGLGKAVAGSIALMLRLNAQEGDLFYGRVNEDAIGVVGGSQGGPGAVNASIKFEGVSEKIKCICNHSQSSKSIATGIGWYKKDFSYEAVDKPFFMMATTGPFDEAIIPTADFDSEYDECTNAPTVIKGRAKYAEHGDTLVFAKGYTVAWFLWQLCGDSEAANVFIGDNAELFNNARWIDVAIKNN